MKGRREATYILHLLHFHHLKFTSQAKTVCLFSLTKVVCSHIESVAGCQECMGSVPQDKLSWQENATQGNSAASSDIQEDNLEDIGRTRLAHSPSVAGRILRAKGKSVQKTVTWNDNPPHQEGRSDNSSQEGSDLEIESHMFDRVFV